MNAPAALCTQTLSLGIYTWAHKLLSHERQRTLALTCRSRA